MPIAQHSSEHNEHYTPESIVTPARTVLGHIDLDPASCPIGNEVVLAKTFYSENGLLLPWFGNVFLNPPGGRAEIPGLGTNSNAVLWWAKLAAEYERGNVQAAIFIGFTLEILSTAQGMPGLQPLDFPFCVPAGRTCFDVDRLAEIARLEGEIKKKTGGTIVGDGIKLGGAKLKDKKLEALTKRLAKIQGYAGTRVASESPTHANVILFLPAERGQGNRHEVERFRDEFSKLGKVCVPS